MSRDLYSVSKGAQGKRMNAVFTATSGYILRPGAKVRIHATDILVTAPLVNGLYQVPTGELYDAMEEVVSTNCTSDDDSAARGDSEDTTSTN
jgi:hypothetical protein